MPAGRMGFQAMAPGIIRATGEADRSRIADAAGRQRTAAECAGSGKDRRRPPACFGSSWLDPRYAARRGRSGRGQRAVAFGRRIGETGRGDLRSHRSETERPVWWRVAGVAQSPRRYLLQAAGGDRFEYARYHAGRCFGGDRGATPGAFGLMPRYWFPKSYADMAQRLRVPIGFLLVAAFAWWSRPNAFSLACGVPVSIAG